MLKVVLHFWPSPKRCVCVAVEDEEALKTKTELSFQLLCGRAKHHASPLSCVHVQLWLVVSFTPKISSAMPYRAVYREENESYVMQHGSNLYYLYIYAPFVYFCLWYEYFEICSTYLNKSFQPRHIRRPQWSILNNIQCICVVFVFVIYASYNMHHISNVWPLINWMRGSGSSQLQV